ncbi:MAG TPA: tRNA (guanosine(37)-N1)-methyltransferase TrmD [Clostridiales bacterium]|nr:tRNA (guanosine(37)-N1)-methyltransferase TrmD [Clostridiales bacterium]
MRIDIVTLFPDMCNSVLGESIIGRARKNGAIEIECHQLRDYAYNKHRRVDDTPYGGGRGMVMMCEPISQCLTDLINKNEKKPHIIYMSPQGTALTQNKVKELSTYDNLCILCGHYEGVDERVLDEYVDEQISIGDYVLTGGELPALVLADAISRMEPGVLSEEECFTQESHYNGLLEYPQYTKPAVWNDRMVPDVLLSGHHANIEKWRNEQSLLRTAINRPDMIKKYKLSDKDTELLKKYIKK